MCIRDSGYGLGISGNWSPNQNLNFLEGMLNVDVFSGKYGRYSGLALTALYERHFEMPRSFDGFNWYLGCLLYTSPSPRDRTRSRMPSSA